ncbi:MAG: hypothetical protein N2558_01505 [Patescibacteria group bacterium]|nr:hypothetical protein [Patescibacteria group bacterium]
MPKYKEYVMKMINDHKEIFEEFKAIHEKYALDPDGLQAEFNKKGEIVRDIIREYENKLCANTERGIFLRYSGNLAEKFHNEIRQIFPMIDHIGLVPQNTQNTQANQNNKNKNVFNIKKINLSTN